MRPIAAELFISLDNVTESPDKWVFGHDDDEMIAALKARIRTQDAVLMGRKTYDEWAPYWPTSDFEPFASFINTVDKYVVSNSLTQTDWQKTTLVKGDVAAETIRAMKQAPGKTIGTAGSTTLVRWLMQQDLVDELTLTIFPVIAGTGARLFCEGDALQRMKLVNQVITTSGVVIVTYQVRRD